MNTKSYEPLVWVGTLLLTGIALFLWARSINDLNIVVSNQKRILNEISRINEWTNRGNRFTACDGKLLVDELRKSGVELTTHKFEADCEAKK